MKRLKKGHPLYQSWCQMRYRCSNPNNPSYFYYGARGITVCQEWQDNFWQFVEDMGERPEGKTLDRINNDLGYSPDNCKWSSLSEQNKNRRKPKLRVGKYAKGYHVNRAGNYVAEIRVNYKKHYLGTYKTAEEAHQKYLEAVANKLNGLPIEEPRSAVLTN